MRRGVALTIAVAALVAAVRGLPFILWPHAAFDADQAVVGLMAKHLAEGRAFPLFYYGQPYMLAVQAWLAAPLFVIGGASILLLKLPLLALNGAAAALLVWVLVRDVGLRPVAAALASALFIACPPVVGAQLVAAMGGSVEPFVYVLLIWLLRHRPVPCGAVAGFAFLHREFSIYGVGALFLVDVLEGRREWRRVAVKWSVIALAFVAVIQLVRVVRPYNDMFGPELPRLQLPDEAPTFYAITTRLACAAPAEVAANVKWLVAENLPTLLGSTARSANLYYAGAPTAARPWLLIAWVSMLAVFVARTVVLCARQRRPPPSFALFLLIIAVASCVFYVASCDVRGPMLVRYTLLALLGPIAIAAAYFHAEPHARLRLGASVALAAIAAFHGTDYVRIVAGYLSAPPASAQAAVAERLEARGVRYARADYWDGYYITFITNERVIVSSTPHRVLVYESLVSHARDVMYVQRTPCPAVEVVGRYWLCPDDRVTRQPTAAPRFPSQLDVLSFREALDEKYRTGLARQPVPATVDPLTLSVWLREYVRYRFSGCDAAEAARRVLAALDSRGIQPPCGPLVAGAIPRDELLEFRARLVGRLSEWAVDGKPSTAVDAEGEVVWLQAYVVARLGRCNHEGARARVFQQIDGTRGDPGC